jgi:hypothetical protein
MGINFARRRVLWEQTGRFVTHVSGIGDLLHGLRRIKAGQREWRCLGLLGFVGGTF